MAEAPAGGVGEHVVEVREPGRTPRRVSIGAPLVIGREGDGLRVDDLKVSRRHLALEASPAGLVLTDLGSRNGTVVNGRPVTEPVVVTAGDSVRLGDVEIAVVSGPATSAARPRLEDLEARP